MITDFNVKQVQERAKKAFEKEDQWRGLLEDCYEYCLPNRNLFDEASEGQKKMQKIFDSTAIEAIQTGASKLQENIAPIWTRWATLEPSEEVQRLPDFESQENAIRENLQKRASIIFDYLHRSNFSSQFYEACLDLLIGTCSIAIEETGDMDNPIAFQTIPQKGIAFEEGRDGTVKTHFRKHSIKARLIEQTYNGFQASHAIKQTIEKEPETEIKITQCVIYQPKDKTYHGLVWVDGEDRFSWYEEYKESNPWNTSRYSKSAGEVRGRGVAVQALPDIKTLNKAKEFSLQKAALDLAGMWTAKTNDVINPWNIEITPGIVIPIEEDGDFNRLDTATDLNLTMFVVEDLKRSIQKMFFGDLREPGDPVRSATEIAIDARELAKRVGSAFGRLQTELLTPILTRVDWILTRLGKLTPIKIDGKEVAFKFTSPLARTQDAEDLYAVQQAVEFVLATAGEEAVQMAYKTEDFGTWAGEKTGMAQELIRSDTEKKDIIKAGAEAAMMQQSGELPNDVGRTEARQQGS